MTMVDNTELIAQYIDDKDDGDTFWYTELLDRRTNGLSRFKLLRNFEHNSRLHFLQRVDTIRLLCEQTGLRAYTRLSPRSRKKVGHELIAHLFKTVVMDKVYGQAGRAYASTCGKHPIHDRKLWLFDVDIKPGFERSAALEMEQVEHYLSENSALVGKIPTKNGWHLIARPHHVNYSHDGIELHKDNPTVLYIPAGAR